MSKTQTAREYLVSLGLAKAGRGKFSTAAHEALAKAIASGMEFTDTARTPSTPRLAKVKKSTEFAYETPAMTWPNGTAKYKATGKKLSMKESCNGCGYALYWCECQTPRVLMKEVVISQT